MKAVWALARMLREQSPLLGQFVAKGNSPDELRPLPHAFLGGDEIGVTFDHLASMGGARVVSTQSTLRCPRCHGVSFEVMDSDRRSPMPPSAPGANPSAPPVAVAVSDPRPVGIFPCPNCGAEEIVPGYLLWCPTCRTSYDASVAEREVRRSYTLQPAGIASLLEPLDELTRGLEAEGLTVTAPSQLVGVSGVGHLFDLVIHGASRPIAVMIEEAAGGGVDERAVLAQYARLRDLPDVDGLLVASPGLRREAFLLAESYDMHPLECPSVAEGAHALVERARSLLRAASRSTGIPGLDELLGGGFPRPGAYLLLGGPTAGATTLAVQFATQGARLGLPCVYLLARSRPEELLAEADRLGLQFRGWVDNGLVTLLDVSGRLEEVRRQARVDPSRLRPYVSRLVGEIGFHVRRHRASRLVVDPLGPLVVSGSPETTAELLAALDGLGCLTLLLLDDRDPAVDQLSGLVRGSLWLQRDEGRDAAYLTVAGFPGLGVAETPRELRLRKGTGWVVSSTAPGRRATLSEPISPKLGPERRR